MNHTPGPWQVCDDEINVYAPETDTAITNVEHPCAADYDTQRANAKVIAAAPDLLAACQWVVTDIAYKAPEEFADEAVHSRWLARLREAIAKAKGSEQ